MAQHSPAPSFVDSLQAALRYWQQRLQEATPAQLEGQRQNLYRAVQLGLALPGTQEAAAHVAIEAFSFVLARGYWQEWLPVLEQAVDVTAPAQIASRFWLLTRLGNLRRLTGNLSGALSAHREALDLVAQSGQPLLQAEAHFHLGRALRDAHRYAEALAQLQTGEQMVTQLDGKDADKLAASISNVLGCLAKDMGRLADAQLYLERAVTLHEGLALFALLADDLHDLANVFRAAGATSKARRYYQDALRLLKGKGHRLRRAQIQVSMGALSFEQQDFVRAEAVFRQIDLSFLRETGNLDLQARILVSLGNALLYQSRYEEAARVLGESVSLWRQLEDEINLANAIGSLGEALAGMGQVWQAHDKFAQALVLLANYPDDAMAARLRTFYRTEQEKAAG